MMKPFLPFLLLAASLAAQTAETGAARAERFLAAMGGPTAWAQVKFVHVEAVHDRSPRPEHMCVEIDQHPIPVILSAAKNPVGFAKRFQRAIVPMDSSLRSE